MGQRRQAGRSFNLSDQRICADRHPEPAHQTLAGTSSEGTSYRGDDLGHLRPKSLLSRCPGARPLGDDILNQTWQPPKITPLRKPQMATGDTTVGTRPSTTVKIPGLGYYRNFAAHL